MILLKKINIKVHVWETESWFAGKKRDISFGNTMPSVLC